MEWMLIGKEYPGAAIGMTWARCRGGMEVLSLMVDLFCRHIEVELLKDQTTHSIVQAIEHGWIYKGHGVPGIILSDQGPSIDGVEIRLFCVRLGIENVIQAPTILREMGWLKGTPN